MRNPTAFALGVVLLLIISNALTAIAWLNALQRESALEFVVSVLQENKTTLKQEYRTSLNQAKDEMLEECDHQMQDLLDQCRKEKTELSKGLYTMFPCDQGRQGLCFGSYPPPGVMR